MSIGFGEKYYVGLLLIVTSFASLDHSLMYKNFCALEGMPCSDVVYARQMLEEDVC